MESKNRVKALEVELQQIILADKLAADAIRSAKQTRDAIAASAEKQREEILADAKRIKEENEKQVRQKRAQELERRKEEAQKQYLTKRQQLDEKVAHNRENWVDEIVREITKS